MSSIVVKAGASNMIEAISLSQVQSLIKLQLVSYYLGKENKVFLPWANLHITSVTHCPRCSSEVCCKS
jgi:hypothetical protein